MQLFSNTDNIISILVFGKHFVRFEINKKNCTMCTLYSWDILTEVLSIAMLKVKVYFATLSQRQHFPDLLLLIISNICLHDCFCQPTFSCHQPPQNIIINTLHSHKGVTGKGLGAWRGPEVSRTQNTQLP